MAFREYDNRDLHEVEKELRARIEVLTEHIRVLTAKNGELNNCAVCREIEQQVLQTPGNRIKVRIAYGG